MNQRIVFIIFVGIGCLIGLSPLMLYIHELGHLQSFTFDGIWAEITAPATTMTAMITFHGLAAGCLSEFTTAWIFFWIFFIFSSKDSLGLRRFWFPAGLPLGICTIVFFKAFLYTDFNREWSGDLQTLWIVVVLPMLALIWIIVSVTRIK